MTRMTRVTEKLAELSGAFTEPTEWPGWKMEWNIGMDRVTALREIFWLAESRDWMIEWLVWITIDRTNLLTDWMTELFSWRAKWSYITLSDLNLHYWIITSRRCVGLKFYAKEKKFLWIVLWSHCFLCDNRKHGGGAELWDAMEQI
jgi:hypothetical protein